MNRNTSTSILAVSGKKYHSGFHIGGSGDQELVPPGLYLIRVPATTTITVTMNCGTYTETTGANPLNFFWNSKDSNLTVNKSSYMLKAGSIHDEEYIYLGNLNLALGTGE